MGEMKTSDMSDHPELLAPGLNIVHGVALEQQLKKLPNMHVLTSTKALDISDEGVRVGDKDGERLIPAGTVIYAVGQRPLTDDALAFSELAPEFYPLGDCLAPANIMAATSLAYQIARDIGRI
jgi:hypothetical protein